MAKGREDKPKILQPDDWDARLLAEKRYFKIVLANGEKLEAKFKGANAYNVLVETPNKLVLIPKHSVKFYVLDEFGEEEDQDGVR